MQTARMAMRQFVDGDTAALHRICNQPGVRRYLWDGHPASREQIRAAAAGSLRFWVLEYPPGGPVIGFCAFRYFAHTEEVELLYAIDMEHWGVGLAAEAAAEALRHAFEDLGWESVTAYANPYNIPSWRVLERLGMAEEGCIEYNNEPLKRYALSRRHWLEHEAPGLLRHSR